MNPIPNFEEEPNKLSVAREVEAEAIARRALDDEARQAGEDPETSGQITEATEDQWARERQERAEVETHREQPHG